LNRGLITTTNIPSGHQLKDVLANGLPTKLFSQLTWKQGMRN